MKAVIILGVGIALAYLGITGKADKTLRAAFGKQSGSAGIGIKAR